MYVPDICCQAVENKMFCFSFLFFFFPKCLHRTPVKLHHGSNVTVWWGCYVRAPLRSDSCVLRSYNRDVCVCFGTRRCLQHCKAESPFPAPRPVNTHHQLSSPEETLTRASECMEWIYRIEKSTPTETHAHKQISKNGWKTSASAEGKKWKSSHCCTLDITSLCPTDSICLKWWLGFEFYEMSQM